MAIEEKYEIEVAEADAKQFTSLGNIAAYIEAKLGGE
jgi:acyl carrier protein